MISANVLSQNEIYGARTEDIQRRHGVPPGKVFRLWSPYALKLVTKFEKVQVRALDKATIQLAKDREKCITQRISEAFNEMEYDSIYLLKVALPIRNNIAAKRVVVCVVKKSSYFATFAGISAVLILGYYFGTLRKEEAQALNNGLYRLHSDDLSSDVKRGEYGQAQKLCKKYLRGSLNERQDVIRLIHPDPSDISSDVKVPEGRTNTSSPVSTRRFRKVIAIMSSISAGLYVIGDSAASAVQLAKELFNKLH